MTWIDFVSQIGGVLGLCIGFSLISLIEIIYWFTLRLGLRAANSQQNKQLGVSYIGADRDRLAVNL